MAKMKCPLRYKIEKHAATFVEFEFPDCLKEECAWWDCSTNGCDIHRIGVNIRGVSMILEDLVKKMPHGEE